MKLLNAKRQIKETPARWRDTYGNGYWAKDLEKQTIQRRLDALDLDSASAADLQEIIGNDSWCKPQTCNECGIKSYDVVQLGDEPDYESATVLICYDCLEQAMSLTKIQLPLI